MDRCIRGERHERWWPIECLEGVHNEKSNNTTVDTTDDGKLEQNQFRQRLDVLEKMWAMILNVPDLVTIMFSAWLPHRPPPPQLLHVFPRGLEGVTVLFSNGSANRDFFQTAEKHLNLQRTWKTQKHGFHQTAAMRWLNLKPGRCWCVTSICERFKERDEEIYQIQFYKEVESCNAVSLFNSSYTHSFW